MKMVAVESSNLTAIGYENGVLRVAFKNGAMHDHFDVPQAVHSALLAADSHGKHYIAHVCGKYDSRPAQYGTPALALAAARQQPAPPDLDTAIRRFHGDNE